MSTISVSIFRWRSSISRALFIMWRLLGLTPFFWCFYDGVIVSAITFCFECVEKAAKLGRRFIFSEKWLNVFHLFQDGFETLHLRLYQLDRLIEEYLPDLWNHLVENCIENHMYASQWFLTLFTAKFPLFLVFHILDVFLYQGMETIFQVSFKMKGKEKHFGFSVFVCKHKTWCHASCSSTHLGPMMWMYRQMKEWIICWFFF